MNDPFESYKLYNALKLHFESKYDAVKYNYKTSVTPNSFFKRKDKYFFAKLAKTHGKHLKEFYNKNKSKMSYKQAMKEAKKTYKPKAKK